MELVPLRVSIGLKSGGGHAFPDFNTLATVKTSGMDWSYYVDQTGLGWQYDQCCGHDRDTVASPVGTWIGVLLVPLAFATEAIVGFPAECSRLSEADLSTFWDEHLASQEADTIDDERVLQAIASKRTAGLPETASDRAALDPASPVSGIRENHRKTWMRFKAHTGTTIARR